MGLPHVASSLLAMGPDRATDQTLSVTKGTMKLHFPRGYLFSDSNLMYKRIKSTITMIPAKVR
mgnify:CR=1 FL=1